MAFVSCVFFGRNERCKGSAFVTRLPKHKSQSLSVCYKQTDAKINWQYLHIASESTGFPTSWIKFEADACGVVIANWNLLWFHFFFLLSNFQHIRSSLALFFQYFSCVRCEKHVTMQSTNCRLNTKLLSQWEYIVAILYDSFLFTNSSEKR